MEGVRELSIHACFLPYFAYVSHCKILQHNIVLYNKALSLQGVGGASVGRDCTGDNQCIVGGGAWWPAPSVETCGQDRRSRPVARTVARDQSKRPSLETRAKDRVKTFFERVSR